MDKRQMKKFRNALLKWKERVFKEVNQLESDTLGKSQKDFSGDLSGYSFHIADMGTDTFDKEFALGLISNQQEFIYEIDEALKRIDDGTYGKCENCKKAISLKRLNALPFARLCIKCQGVEEKNK